MPILLSVLIAAADQAIKLPVRASAQGHVFFRIPGFLEITHCTNTGAAFSAFSGRTFMLAALSVLLLAGLTACVLRMERLSRAGAVSFACLLGGGIGNLIDRIVFGGVTDYIRLLFIRFPVFNVADMAITLSVGALVLLILAGRLEETTGDRDG